MNPSSSLGLTVQRGAFRVAAELQGRFGALLGRLARPAADAIDLPEYPVPVPA
jgi:hypothetical protein